MATFDLSDAASGAMVDLIVDQAQRQLQERALCQSQVRREALVLSPHISN